MRFLAAALFVVTGCGGSDGRPAQGQDSSAELVVEYPIAPSRSLDGTVELLEHRLDLRRLPASLVTESAPIAATASSDPAYDLTHVRDVVVTADGMIVGYDRLRSTILVFDSAGVAAETFGGRGEGPGEFVRAAGPLLIPPDTVVMVDWVTARISRMVPGHGMVGSGRLPASGIPPWTNSVAGMLADGSLIAHSAGVLGGEILADTATRTNASISLLAAGGGARLIASVPDLAIVPRGKVEPAMAVGGPLLVRLGAHADVAQWDSLVAVSSSPAWSIELFDSAGTVVRRITADFGRRVLSAGEKQEVTDHVVAMRLAGGMAEGGEAHRYETAVPVVDTLPAIGRLMVGEDSLLWAVEAGVPGDTVWYATAFDRDGRIVGRLRSPLRGMPLWFGAGRVLVRVEDDSGIISLRVHRMVRSPLVQ